MASAKLKAAQVSRQLGDAGFESRLRARSGSDEWKSNSRDRGYQSRGSEDGSVLVVFHGRPSDEDGMLQDYERVLTNLGYRVERGADPEREGRIGLRVFQD